MTSNYGRNVSSSATDINHVIAGLVLARGGSVGIPRKNIRFVAGLPLLAWVLEPLKNSPHISSVWVSTDDAEIAEVALKCGAQIHQRKPTSAKSESSSLAGIQDFLESHPEITVVALVQCTSPCLHPKYLNMACNMVTKSGYDSVFSVFRQHKLRWKEVFSDESTVALNFDTKNRPRRQDWNGELVESGHFYIANVSLIQKGFLQGGRCGYIEVPEEYCFEIDSYKDLLIAEELLKTYGYKCYTNIKYCDRMSILVDAMSLSPPYPEVGRVYFLERRPSHWVTPT